MLEISQKTHKTTDHNLEVCQKALQVFMQRKDIGFPDLPFRMPLWNTSIDLAKKMSSKFKKLVIVGIGGSAVGPQVLCEVFQKKNIVFLDNVDPAQFQSVLKDITDFEEVAWAFVSKSGSTIETLCTLEYVLQTYKDKGLELPEQSVVISENHNPTSNSLVAWAKEFNVPVLEIPKDVGGRYSVLSPVGIFPAAFAGLNVELLRKGAIAALKETSLATHVMAQALQSFERQEWLTLFWFYNSTFRWFGVWLQQLWAESLGKAVNRDGEKALRVSSPLWAVGASDQHSILQQVMEGARDKFVIFFRFESLEIGPSSISHTHFSETAMLKGKSMGELLKAEALATQEALEQNHVSTMTFKTKVLDEGTIGFYFMFFQLVVAGLGEVLRLNAFDQPGVELGKRLAKEKLSKS
jgi:glucose-6-phosphate isomerase